MKGINIDSLSIDQLSTLEDEVRETLAARIAEEKIILEKRLSQLAQRFRRPYPRLLPKYRNPDQPSETWSGHGKQPRWLTTQLRSGKRIEDFLIAHPRSGKDAAKASALQGRDPSFPKSRSSARLQAARAVWLAERTLEKIEDPTAPPQDRAHRRRKLTNGPSEFREDRIDQPEGIFPGV
jgi:DNA-binding protein H-NS